MKVELKRVTHSKRLSQETSCFAGDLWIDGAKVGEVRNDGRGGCHHLTPWTIQETLGAHALTLPLITVPVEADRFFTYQPTWETLIDWALERHLSAKAYRAMAKKKLVFLGKDGKLHSFEYPNRRPIAPVVAQGEPAVLAQICPGRYERCLNCLPETEALALYFKGIGIPE